MPYILIFGAGRSATSLIEYLLHYAAADQYRVLVADIDLELAKRKIGHSEFGEGVYLDIHDLATRRRLIADSFLVISMLPPALHHLVATDCLKLGKDLFTASYKSKEISDLNDEVKSRGLLFLTEIGLDPGIDHMSAMKIITGIQKSGGTIESFKSFTGGLVSPTSDTNPWHYKVTWNPRNVVLAGNRTARLREHGEIKYVPQLQLFREASDIQIKDVGTFEMYPNRDSVSYALMYGLDHIPTIIRGTLRHPGFCKAWSALVALGLTDDEVVIGKGEFATFSEFLQAFLPSGDLSFEDKIMQRSLVSDPRIVAQIKWLFDDEPLPSYDATAAQLLEYLIVKKWKLNEEDRDLVVMYHEIKYQKNQTHYIHTSSLSMEGEDSINTAMTKLVGLPLGISARLRYRGKLDLIGVQTPIQEEVFLPVLEELEKYQVSFVENCVEI